VLLSVTHATTMLQIAEPAMTHYLRCSPSCAEMSDVWHSDRKKGHEFEGANQGCLRVPGVKRGLK